MVFFRTNLAAGSVWALAGLDFTRVVVASSLAILSHYCLAILLTSLLLLSLEFLFRLPRL